MEKLPHNHLAEGEVTGHFHAAEGAATVYQLGDGTRQFDGEGVVVTHQEHGPITLSPGLTNSARVQEYDPFLEEARQVQD